MTEYLVYDIGALARVLANKTNKKIVLMGGTFDLLHVNHLRALENAKARGDILVVAINNDSQVKKRKGPHRPIVTARQRASLVAGLKPVDYVFITAMPFYEEKTINKIKPNKVIFCKEPGTAAWRKKMAKELQQKFANLEVHFNKYCKKPALSTSLMVEKILAEN